MHWFEALVLGVLQGLTEFLPVSSSGHLEIGKVLFGDKTSGNLYFTVSVHFATVLSTLIIFRKDIFRLATAMFRFRWETDMKFITAILISMIPVGLVGLFLADKVEALFTGNLLLVGCMLLVTAGLLTLAHFSKDRGKEISLWDGFIIGIAQAVAVIPGISRSGATIATGMMLGNRRTEIARFSFLMVIIPVIGATLRDLFFARAETTSVVPAGPLAVGFVAAFITGLLACRFMIRIVQKGNLLGFAIYCMLVGIVAVLFAI